MIDMVVSFGTIKAHWGSLFIYIFFFFSRKEQILILVEKEKKGKEKEFSYTIKNILKDIIRSTCNYLVINYLYSKHEVKVVKKKY